jgi:hypothetical protein
MICQEDLTRRNEALARTIDKMKAAKSAGFQDLGFDMMSWFARNTAHECGTAACIAGWVVHANSNLEIPELIDIGKGNNSNIPERARELLRLSAEEASILFFAQSSETQNLPFYNVTIDHAIGVLEHFLETGTLTWQALPDLEALVED